MSARRRRGPSPLRRKTLPTQMTLGQQGINLIEKIVLAMGCRWQQTSGTDVGIDGLIELFDPSTREALGIVLHVQSKATEGNWGDETDDAFAFPCRREDVDYWLRGNAPVLLIVSRPKTGEAFWVAIKDYFTDPQRKQSMRVRFSKKDDRFSVDAYAKLLTLSKPPELGLYLAPVPKAERLISNLVEVRSFGPKLFVADTPLRLRQDVFAYFRGTGGRAPTAFVLKNKRLITFHDLHETPWRDMCDQGTVEDFESREWAFSPDVDRRNEFVELLNGALEDKLHPEVQLWRKSEVFAFSLPQGGGRRQIRYVLPSGRRGKRTVLESYPWQWQGKSYTRYRHWAFEWNFRVYEGCWFLELAPTYLFTWNGRSIDRRHSELLKGIKRREHSPAVLAQLLVWSQYLQREGDLFAEAYPYLSFGPPRAFELDVGIDEKRWLTWEGKEAEKVAASQQRLLEDVIE